MADFLKVHLTGRIIDTPVVKTAPDGKEMMGFKIEIKNAATDNGKLEIEVVLIESAADLNLRAREKIMITGGNLIMRKGKLRVKCNSRDYIYKVDDLCDYDQGTVSADEIL